MEVFCGCLGSDATKHADSPQLSSLNGTLIRLLNEGESILLISISIPNKWTHYLDCETFNNRVAFDGSIREKMIHPTTFPISAVFEPRKTPTFMIPPRLFEKCISLIYQRIKCSERVTYVPLKCMACIKLSIPSTFN